MRETQLEHRFATEVERAGGRSFKLVSSVAGIPDRMVLAPGGKIFLVELKTPSGRVAPIQEVWHRRAAELGTKVHVLFGSSDVTDWVGTHI